jgi:hypothetical protein
MSHVSSVATSSYPYRGTLSRLDQNGDGMLSSDERAAGQSPGLLDADPANDSTVGGPLSSLAAKLMQLPSSAQTDYTKLSLMQAGMSSSAATTIADQQTIDAYRGTYGRYELDSVA